MKFFVYIDFEDCDKGFWELEKLVKAGLLADVATELSVGFTPNGVNTRNIDEVYQLIKRPMIAKYKSNNYTAILKEGQALAKISQNIILTVPLTQDGLCACKALTEQEIKVNVALCYSITQALLAANAGATYISIPANHLENSYMDGISLIEKICNIYKKYEVTPQILLTSIDNLHQVEQAANIGVHAVAVPSSIFSMIIPKVEQASSIGVHTVAKPSAFRS